jgi:uncharacterized Zn-binding protein involved in type VI secretion
MGMPAARVGDMHVCPMVTGIVPHVGGPILPPGGIPVLIGGLPAARVGDQATCIGPPDVIVLGSFKVLIRGQPAARMGDTTAPRRDHRNGLSDRSDRLSRAGSRPAQGVRCPVSGLPVAAAKGSGRDQLSQDRRHRRSRPRRHGPRGAGNLARPVAGRSAVLRP